MRHSQGFLLSRAPRVSGVCASLSTSLVSFVFAFFMASRRESTASRAQGKHPTESSQPAQTEACQKARFDTTLFSTMEDYQRYKQNFAQRKVVPRRSMNFSQLQHFRFEGLFSQIG